jgi:thiosulfate/3-mercaptopyruvate sulfurtransferase
MTRNGRAGWLVTCLAVACLTLAGPAPGAEDEQRAGQMLKEPFDLKLQLGDSELVIVDIRDDEAFAAAHAPGAVRLDSAAWKKKSLEPGGLKDAPYWRDEISRLGIANESQVVVVGDDMPEVARTWWLLKYVGVTHASILNGGWNGWVAGKFPVTDAATEPEAADFTPKFQTDRLVELKDVLQRGATPVLDARTADEHANRIPGAIHLEWKDLMTEEGKFRSPAEVRKLIEAAGLTGTDEVITHCQSGGRASVNVFALELAGIKVRNYYCGWSEYSKSEAAPVEKKPADGK